jgi:hypothetical protein
VIGALWWALACESPLHVVPNTTIRVSNQTGPSSAGASLPMVRIFETREECEDHVKEAFDDCVPFVDRASGQVRVAFQLQIDSQPWPVSLSNDSISVQHNNQIIARDQDGMDYEIIPHEPVPTPTLFVLLIDGSGSMSLPNGVDGRTRMDTLKDALRRKDVIDTFFRPEPRTRVSILVFAGDTFPKPLGGKWVISDEKEYRALIKDELKAAQGYTFLYRAVDYGTDAALQQPEIKKLLSDYELTPTVIALTDGFNNHKREDVCRDNAPRLQQLLEKLDRVSRGETVENIRYRPFVYTVGLGRSAWRHYRRPDSIMVSAGDLCRGKGAEVIDGGVERAGVDNAALDLIAFRGGGKSYVARTSDGLADAFVDAAAQRYKWFEARYRLDPFYLRRSFEAKLKMTALFRNETTIRIFPSGWIDGPPGIIGKDGWARQNSLLATSTVILPVLGLLITLAYLPAAVFNVRRAMFSVISRRK